MSPKMVHCDASTNFLLELFSFTNAYVEPDIAGQMVAENIPELFSWHWPGDDEWILLILTSIIYKTIFPIVNATIHSPPDPSQEIQEL